MDNDTSARDLMFYLLAQRDALGVQIDRLQAELRQLDGFIGALRRDAAAKVKDHANQEAHA